MFSVFRTLSVRYVSRRWVRAALIVASISLGVATLVATQALNQTMSQAAVASANPLAGVADLIVSNDELPLARDLVREIARAPFVDSARPFLTGKVTLPDVKDGPNEREILVLGLDLIAEMTQPKGLGGDISLLPDTATVKLEFLAWGFTEYTAVIGRHLATDLKILVDGKLNREHAKLRVVNRAAIRVDRAEPNEHAVRVVGAMDAQGESRALAGPVMVLDLSAAAAVLDLPTDRVHRIDVLLKPGTNIEEARDELRKVLAGRALVRTVAEQNESVLAVMRGMQTGFSLCGLAALVVGMFLVYNSMAVTVAERRHEIGVLRALGATRAQVWRLFAAEAALLGLAGSLLGIPLGIGLANVGLGPMQSVLQDLFYTVEAREVHVSRTLLAVALIVGILTSVAAALVPAFQASQEAPAEAVRRVAKAPSTRRLVVQASVSAVAVLVGLTLILLRDEFPHRLGTYGGLAIIMINAARTLRVAAVQVDDFKTEGVVASSSWGFQVNLLQADKKPVASVVPDEGATGWADTTMMHVDAPHPNCAYAWLEHSLEPKLQGDLAAWFGSLPAVPAACQGNALLGEKGCETNGFAQFDQIAFWKTPKADCGNGRTDCVPYHEWVTNYIAVIGGR